MDDLSEDHLVSLSKQGDVEAFTALALRYQERIYNTILGLTRNHLDADDLSQETFMKAFKSLKGFKQDSSFYTWLYKIAVNLTLNFLKKSGKERKKTDSLMSNYGQKSNPAKNIPSPEDFSLKQELRTKLKQAMDDLPPSYRVAFFLVEFEGLLHREAATVLNCSENTISWRLHKARKMLQSKLKPYLERGKT
jgi:RNA polymerase sigma-70 factor (ECF subfamily)